MPNQPSSTSQTVPLSEVLLRALLPALAVALLSAVSAVAWSQQADSAAARWQPVRAVDDPATGSRWLLQRDTAHAGAPGRMERVAQAGRAVAAAGAVAMLAAVAPPAIRAGDRIVVEEETAKVSARLQAVALGPARVGGLLKARLAVGGHIVDARAIAPGHATLVPAAPAHAAGKGAGQ